MWDTKEIERGSRRAKLIASSLLQRFLLYQDSWDFINTLELQDDFHIHNSVANMHLWLLMQRLRDFPENLFAKQLSDELLKGFNQLITSEMDDVQVLRRHKKIEELDNYMYAIRRNLDFHFFVNGITSTVPEYKLDALVWSCIFHEKVPRYSDQVYKMASYLLEHYKYLKTLSYTDLEVAIVDWGAHRIPYNVRERFTRIAANKPLSLEEFEAEYDSPYKVKKYHYNYRHPEELDQKNLVATFVNMSTAAYFEGKDKTVRVENLNLDSRSSKEREMIMHKLKVELEKIGTIPDEDSSFFSALANDRQVQTQYKLWRQNMAIPLTDQLREHAERKI